MIRFPATYCCLTGVVITAAAGNDGSSIEGYFPAVCPHVIAVTALDSTGKSAATSYSNWIATTDTAGMAHAVAAPGTAVLSTVPTAVDSSGYYMLTGTSGVSAPACCFLGYLTPILASAGSAHMETVAAVAWQPEHLAVTVCSYIYVWSYTRPPLPCS